MTERSRVASATVTPRSNLSTSSRQPTHDDQSRWPAMSKLKARRIGYFRTGQSQRFPSKRKADATDAREHIPTDYRIAITDYRLPALNYQTASLYWFQPVG